ncbi:hypothetical protein GCM10022224_104460 [Nonomuraea antimicrobica]|uniref:Uncharacterized protein n=2 Tax=Nonomuraea antimicrobica TaxID=561173 RepID=A0ABP7ERS3_9ACTN
MAEVPAFICGGHFSPEVPPSGVGVVILPWQCPLCEGEGRWGDGSACVLCDGRGAITAEAAADWLKGEPEVSELKRSPVPPGVMRKPCGDCALRPGSPEEDEPPSPERPFYCHFGMRVVNGSYAPAAWFDGRPLGALVCRGWWNAVTGLAWLAEPYRPARDGWGRRA